MGDLLGSPRSAGLTIEFTSSKGGCGHQQPACGGRGVGVLGLQPGSDAWSGAEDDAYAEEEASTDIDSTLPPSAARTRGCHRLHPSPTISTVDDESSLPPFSIFVEYQPPLSIFGGRRKRLTLPQVRLRLERLIAA
ncbi:hypothetical protein KSP40_PGU011828 [Platanthera guangdongensis]|uniref:Uncharacterized protein n=1 Tax=Platanthera guangdongensis TaxID=2320717 RepID=A0ABR2MVK4_9ASPA